jgi:hypothetical protein
MINTIQGSTGTRESGTKVMATAVLVKVDSSCGEEEDMLVYITAIAWLQKKSE